MKRCKRCVMPETIPGITFNKDRICSFCLNYQKEKYLGKEKLERIIASIKKEDNEYDCIVPLSGGRDSTFILHMAKAIYNLKVLAVNYDNEFRIDQALTNMKKACEMLDVNFVSVRSNRDIAQKMVRFKVRIFAQHGPPLLVCRACTYGYRSVVYRAAEEYKVPLILWGESQAERTIHMGKRPFAELGLKRLKLLFNINFYRFEYCSLLQRFEFYVPGNSILHLGSPILKNKNIKEIRFFDYIPWDRQKIKDTIMRELGWEKPQGHVSTWRIDCMLHSLINYSFFKLFGCSKDCFGYCNMINSGQMDREEALKQEEEMAASFTENIRELLEDKIGLSKKEAAKILSFQEKI